MTSVIKVYWYLADREVFFMVWRTIRYTFFHFRMKEFKHIASKSERINSDPIIRGTQQIASDWTLTTSHRDVWSNLIERANKG